MTKELIFIGDWCLFIFQKRWLIGVILSFSYMNQKTIRAQEYGYSSAKTQETGPKSLGVLCNWYEWTSGGNLKPTYPNKSAQLKHAFVTIDCYKATIASPSFNDKALRLHPLVVVEMTKLKGVTIKRK